MLTRGYPREQSLHMIAIRYKLDKSRLILLNRCVHPQGKIDSIRYKLEAPQKLRGERLAIDGYNQLTTIYAALSGGTILRCLDGVTRDNMLSGPRPVTENIDILAQILSNVIRMLSPSHTIIVLDSQPSWSGRTASYLRRTLAVEVVLSKNADKKMIELSHEGYIVATSDITILDEAPRVFDLAGYAIEHILGKRIPSISHAIVAEHEKWCKKGISSLLNTADFTARGECA